MAASIDDDKAKDDDKRSYGLLSVVIRVKYNQEPTNAAFQLRYADRKDYAMLIFGSLVAVVQGLMPVCNMTVYRSALNVSNHCHSCNSHAVLQIMVIAEAQYQAASLDVDWFFDSMWPLLVLFSTFAFISFLTNCISVSTLINTSTILSLDILLHDRV